MDTSNLSAQEVRQEDQQFKVILTYTYSLGGPAWAIGDPVGQTGFVST